MTTSNEIRSMPPGDGEISFRDLAATLARRWKIVLYTTAVCVAATALVLLLLPDMYMARTVLVPSADRRNDVGLRAQIAAQIPGGLPISVGGAGAGQQNLIEVVISSQSLADSMVARVRSTPRFRAVEPSQVRKILAEGVRVEGDALGGGAVTVTVTAARAELAAYIANQFPPLINEIAGTLGAELALRKAEFIERQLATAATRLAESEARMLRFEKQTDAVDLQEQAKRTVEAAARLQEAVTEQELKVAAIRRTATANNPALRAAEAELGARRQQLRSLTGGAGGNRSLYVPLGESPELKLAATRVTRDYARDEQIYKALTAALTQARMDASQNLPIVGVLDVATPPAGPVSRHRSTVIVAALLAGIFLGLLLAYIAEYLRRVRRSGSNPNLLAA